MALTITKIVQQKLVYPEKDGNENVIGMVEWAIIFNIDGIESVARISTMLNTDNIQNFKPISEITDEELIEMCLVHEGGEKFIDMLLETHAPIIEYERTKANLVPYLG